MKPELFVVGCSFRSASLELRERLAIDTQEVTRALAQLKTTGTLSEAILLSTCNRTELYAAAPNPEDGLAKARAYFATMANPKDLERALYVYEGREAVTHSFRVTSSLDSMVVGESQILGQVKDAFTLAMQSGTASFLLERWFSRAFSVAKRVRSATAIASGAVSISSVACELAKKIFGPLEDRHVLLVGAGEMAEDAAMRLAQLGARIVVINRSIERAQSLAQRCDGRALGYEHLASQLIDADVVITSTASPSFIIEAHTIDGIVRARRHRPLFFIDIALPRNVDPHVGESDNVFVYDLDDLEQAASENRKARSAAAQEAERIVVEEVDEFERWRRSLDLTPTIIGLRERFQQIAQQELNQCAKRLSHLSEKDRVALQKTFDAMVNKMLHIPTHELRRSEDPLLIDSVRRLFGLEEAREKPSDQASVDPRDRVLKAVAGGKRGTGH